MGVGSSVNRKKDRKAVVENSIDEELREEGTNVNQFPTVSCGHEFLPRNESIQDENEEDEEESFFSQSSSEEEEGNSGEEEMSLVMISYAWTQDGEDIFYVPRQLAEELRESNFEVWIDQDEMKGDMDEAMAEAVDQCDYFVACISEGYLNSRHCRAEINMAMENEKKVIPVKVVEDFEANGTWLHRHVAGKTHYQFGQWNFAGAFDDEAAYESFSETLEKFLRELR